MGVGGLGEERLDPVGLRADAVDQGDVLAVGIAVDVVATGEPIACGEGGREENAIGAFDGDELFANDECGGAALGEILVELFGVTHGD